MQLSSDLIGAMETDDITEPNAMKNFYKKMMTILIQALGQNTEESLALLTGMKDALIELIEDVNNGDVTLAE